MFQMTSCQGIDFVHTTEFKALYSADHLEKEFVGYDGETYHITDREVNFKYGKYIKKMIIIYSILFIHFFFLYI